MIVFYSEICPKQKEYRALAFGYTSIYITAMQLIAFLYPPCTKSSFSVWNIMLLILKFRFVNAHGAMGAKLIRGGQTVYGRRENIQKGYGYIQDVHR